MNYLHIGSSVLGIAILLGGTTTAPVAQQVVQTRAEDFYNRGINKTQREDYQGAIADLQRSANLFSQQRNPANAYKSKALAIYLQLVEQRRQPSSSSQSLPSWYKLGQCLGEHTCQYGITWAAPEAQETAFGGILILEKFLRMQQKPDGSGSPIEAVLDVRIVPKLRTGELLQGNCELKKKADPQIFAIVQIEGFENQNLYAKVRLAWRANLNSETIDAIPTTNIACINPCPGGC